MTLSHIISDIMWWWRTRHPTLRKDMRKAVLDDLRRV